MAEPSASGDGSASFFVRKARVSDLPRLLDLGEAMHAESSYAGLAFDRAQMERAGRRWLASEDHLCLAGLNGGEAVALFVGMVSTSFFGPDRVAHDLLLFVHPDRRGGLMAARMIERFRAWARSRGAKQLRLSISTGVNPEATGRLYEHLGLARVGGVFMEKL